MKSVNIFIYILILILHIAFLSSCIMPDLQEAEPLKTDQSFSDNIPRWLLLEHLSIERIEIETGHDEDETEDFNDEIIEPEPNSEATSHSEQPAPVKQQNPLPENEDSTNGELSFSEKREIDRAKETLRKIEEKYKTATNEEKVELATRYSQIIKQLNTKYDIVYENKLEKAQWWKIGKDPDPSFHHEVDTETD